MLKFFFTLSIVLAALAATPLQALAEKWSFGIMSDTQWTLGTDTARNPNSVAKTVIDQLNQQFIDAGVKFVIQDGDLTDNGTNAALDTRSAAAQTLYDNGIGFYPLRGNHESSQTAAVRFQTDFPQTQGNGSNVLGATDFSSQSTNLAGLSYAFTYNNARFVLLDQFTGTANSTVSIPSQQNWINSALAAKPAGGQAFVIAHKGLIMGNHADGLFGNTPASDPTGQDAFIQSLQDNNVKYLINGHDHMHNRAVVTTTDGTTAKVQDITTQSDSSKFYTPVNPSNDQKYDVPAFGHTRETPIAQELYNVGYYIFTVDGPKVTVDYYADTTGGYNPSSSWITPVFDFERKETFGYSLNGKEFVVAQGQSFTAVQDAIASGDGFVGTSAAILDGTNGSAVTILDGRQTANAVDTGWAPVQSGKASDVLTLWGMTDLGQDHTDTFALSLSYDTDLLEGETPRLDALDAEGNWVNAVDLNLGGTKQFIAGAWQPGYGLGSYGYDNATHSAWAVVNQNSEYAVSAVPEPSSFALLASCIGAVGFLVIRRKQK